MHVVQTERAREEFITATCVKLGYFYIFGSVITVAKIFFQTGQSTFYYLVSQKLLLLVRDLSEAVTLKAYYIKGGVYYIIGFKIPLPLLFADNFNSAHLLLFDAFIDLGRRLLVGSEQADDAGPLRVQNIPVVISDHLVQLQDPVIGRGQDDDDCGNESVKWRNGCS